MFTHPIRLLVLSALSLVACGGSLNSSEPKSDQLPLSTCACKPIPAGACDALAVPEIGCSKGEIIQTCIQPECGRFAWKLDCKPVAAAFSGAWGGPHLELHVEADGRVNLDFDCATGQFGPVAVDGKGAFRIEGTRLQGTGVELPPGTPRPAAVPVVYSGQIDGENLTLLIARREPGSSQERYELTRGARGTLNRCL
jgi:hypothetical protein